MSRENYLEKQPLLNPSDDHSINDTKSDGLDKAAKAGFWACVFNLSNAALGAGILTYPYAYNRAGYGIGIFFTLAFGCLMGYTLVVISQGAERAYALAREGKAQIKSGSYQEVVAAIIGPAAGKTINLLLLVYLTLSCISYVIIMFEQLNTILISQNIHSSITKKIILTPIVGWAIGYPLANVPNMAWYGVPSTISQFGVVYIVVVVCYYGFTNANTSAPGYDAPIKVYKTNPLLLAECIPLVAFSYQCHVTCPLVYNSMKNRSIGRMRLVIVTCISICVLLYVPTAIAGYYMLGEATPSDVLNGFCKEDSYYSASAKSCVAASDGTTQVGSKTSASIMLSQICMFLSVACSYGLLTFVCRTCICDFIMGPGKKFTRVGYHLETICFVAVTVLAAMFIPDLSIPMEFGGIIVVIQCILFPGLVKLKICETATDRAIGYGLVVIGVCMAVVCLICAVHDSMNQ
eukprot:m.417182 g.417182  ORF g.417182 m.417182 type:complete len:462 (-) comp21286_c0_seq4:1758-3143(-)